jgi:hypothetical protein
VTAAPARLDYADRPLPNRLWITEQGIPFGYRTGRCAAGPVPERAATGAVADRRMLARARASSGEQARPGRCPGGALPRSPVTGGRWIAPTRGEGGRSAFAGHEGRWRQ